MSDLIVAFGEYLSVNKALDAQTVEAYLKDLMQLEAFSSPRSLLKLEIAT